MQVITDSRATHTYTAESIGEVAFDVLSVEQFAVVAGVTSRGVFLRAGTQWIVFLSYEQYRNPLTVTFSTAPAELARLEVDVPAVIGENRIYFPTIDLSVALPSDARWTCPPPAGTVRPPAQRLKRLHSLAQLTGVVAGDRDGLGALLEPLLYIDEADEYPASQEQFRTVNSLLHSLRAGQPADIVPASRHFLGSGTGLTPSGDDFLVGLLLSLNRWPALYRSAENLPSLNRHIVAAAYRETTQLSANLIECATRGTSDERLVRVVDQIVTGAPSSSAPMIELLQWGSSSGVDAFVGMAVAVLAGSTSSRMSERDTTSGRVIRADSADDRRPE